MLQQTQAARVSERFGAFIDRFPTAAALASSDEAGVLAMWSGLGYYRRARSLRMAAAEVVRRGGFPQTAAELVTLPGVGRYTAGAIGSLAFLERTPAVDANVTRVVIRLQGRPMASSDREAVGLAWSRAGELLEAAPRSRPTPALLNEALIELGATVCTPRAPRCGACPVSEHCRARALGIEREIPLPKSAPDRKPLYLASVVVRDDRGRVLVRRRPSEGLWGGLYEAPTVERADRAPTAAEIRRELSLPRARLRPVDSFEFQTTHRRCNFVVFRAATPAHTPRGWKFLESSRVAGLGLSSPQRRILLGAGCGRDG